MFETYDTNKKAYVERTGQYYDLQQKAWVDVPSAMTYDTSEKAWIERLYVGYFTLRDVTGNPQLVGWGQGGDDFQINGSNIVLYTTISGVDRRVIFDLQFDWKGETIEFDLMTNGYATVYFGKAFYYGNGWSSVSGYDKTITGFYNDHVSVPLYTRPDTYEGYEVTSSKIYFQINIAAEQAATANALVRIENVKIGGKKYGFKE